MIYEPKCIYDGLSKEDAFSQWSKIFFIKQIATRLS